MLVCIAGCFAFIVFLLSCYFVPWVGLHYVITVGTRSEGV